MCICRCICMWVYNRLAMSYNKFICIIKYSKTSSNKLCHLSRWNHKSSSRKEVKILLLCSIITIIVYHDQGTNFTLKTFNQFFYITWNCVATSLLSIDKESSCITDSCWAKISRSIELSFFWTGLRPSSQKLLFSFKKDRQVSILSVFNTSRRLTKNLPRLICQY